jgi:hypothetical protein
MMISLSALNSAAAVLLSLLLLGSAAAALFEETQRFGSCAGCEFTAFSAARQATAFYSLACGPGESCSLRIPVPQGASAGIDGQRLSVTFPGCASHGEIGLEAPPPEARVPAPGVLEFSWRG